MCRSFGYLIGTFLAILLVNSAEAGVNLNEPNITIGGINNRTYVVPWSVGIVPLGLSFFLYATIATMNGRKKRDLWDYFEQRQQQQPVQIDLSAALAAYVGEKSLHDPEDEEDEDTDEENRDNSEDGYEQHLMEPLHSRSQPNEDDIRVCTEKLACEIGKYTSLVLPPEELEIIRRYTGPGFFSKDVEEDDDGINGDDCASKYPCHMEKEIMLQLGKALIATAEQL